MVIYIVLILHMGEFLLSQQMACLMLMPNTTDGPMALKLTRQGRFLLQITNTVLCNSIQKLGKLMRC